MPAVALRLALALLCATSLAAQAPAAPDLAAAANGLTLRSIGPAIGQEIGRVRDELRHMARGRDGDAVADLRRKAPRADVSLFRQLDELTAALADLGRRLNGDPVRGRLSMPDSPSIADRVSSAMSASETRQPPTTTQRRAVEIATVDLAALSKEFDALVAGPLTKLRTALEAAGAPWTPRRVPGVGAARYSLRSAGRSSPPDWSTPRSSSARPSASRHTRLVSSPDRAAAGAIIGGSGGGRPPIVSANRPAGGSGLRTGLQRAFR